jgi:predicted secreted protein
LLNGYGTYDESGDDSDPQIVEDNNGTLHVVWFGEYPLPGEGSWDYDIAYASGTVITSRTCQFLQWLPSFSGTAAPELARAGMRTPDNAVMADVRDAASSALLRNVFFTGQHVPVSLATVPNFTGTSAPELVTLQKDLSTGAVCGDVRDASSGAFIQRLWYHGQYHPLDIESMASFAGTSAPDIAVMARRPSDGALAGAVRDASTGALLKRTHFHADFMPKDIEVVPDFAGTSADELVVLGRRSSDGTIAGGVRDASSGALLKRVFFVGISIPYDIEVMPNFADTSAPELVVLGQRATDKALIGKVCDASSGTLLSSVFFDKSYHPIDLEVVSNFGGTTAPELVMLGQRTSDNTVIGEVHDASSGNFVSIVLFESSYCPVGIEVVPSFWGTSAPELAVYAVNPSTGAALGQVKDASSGLLLKNTFFNPDYEIP